MLMLSSFDAALPRSQGEEQKLHCAAFALLHSLPEPTGSTSKMQSRNSGSEGMSVCPPNPWGFHPLGAVVFPATGVGPACTLKQR